MDYVKPPVLRAGAVAHTGNSYPDLNFRPEQIPTRRFRQTPRGWRQGNRHTIAPSNRDGRVKALDCAQKYSMRNNAKAHQEQTIINSSARITRWTDRNIDSSDSLQHGREYTMNSNQWIPRWLCDEDQCSPHFTWVTRSHVLIKVTRTQISRPTRWSKSVKKSDTSCAHGHLGSCPDDDAKPSPHEKRQPHFSSSHLRRRVPSWDSKMWYPR